MGSVYILGALGVLLLAAVASAARRSPAQPGGGAAPAGPGGPPTAPGVVGGGDLSSLTGIASSIPVVGGWAAAGTAAAWAGNRLSGALTGDRRVGSVDLAFSLVQGKGADLSGGVSVSKLAAETTALYGLGMSSGEMAGRELSAALGGSGDPFAAAIAEAIGGGFGAHFVVEPLSSSAFLLTVAPIWVGYTVAADAARLGYGQTGATADFWRRWDQEHERIRGQLQASGFLGAKFTTEEELERIAVPLTDGYMREANRIAFRTWMTRPRGVLGLGDLSDAYAGRWGADRGYFVGQRDLASGQLTHEPALKSWGADYYQLALAHPADALVSFTYLRTVNFRWKLVLRDDLPTDPLTGEKPRPPSWVSASQLELSEAQLKADPLWRQGMLPAPPRRLCPPGATALDARCFSTENLFEVAWLPVQEQVTGVKDKLVEAMVGVGSTLANVVSFMRWMSPTEKRGAFLSELAHAREGVKRGFFRGEPYEAAPDSIQLRLDGVAYNARGEVGAA